ncbi:unnamed protein product [Fusarium graminearum]|nr:unnamed protein product [Fusarium graminearum]
MAAEIPGEDIYSADSDVDSDTGQTEEIPRFDLGLLHKTENTSEDEDILYEHYVPYVTIEDDRVKDMALQIAEKLQFVDKILASFFASIVAEDNKTYIQKQLTSIRQHIARKMNSGSQPCQSNTQTVKQEDAILGDLGHFCEDLFDYSTTTESRDENAQAPEFYSTHGSSTERLHYLQDALEVPYWNFILRDLYRWHTKTSMLSGNILMQALRHIQLKLHINLAKLKDEIKNPDVDRISPLIKGIEARIRLLKNVSDTSTKDEVEEYVYDSINPNQVARFSTSVLVECESTLTAVETTMQNDSSQDTVLSMVAVFIFIALAIGAFSMGFAMALKNGSVGSATDADFWFLLQGNIMWTLGSIMMIVPLFRGSCTQRLDPKLGRWLESLNKYYQHSFSNDAFKPTKVAILDDGVLSVSPTARKTAVSLSGGENQEDVSWDSNDNSKSNTPVGRKSGSATIRSDAELEYNSSLSSRIKEGRSFVAGGSSHSPWHLACNPHGTQMANLICAIDPLCEIYVARVAEDAVGITPDRVTKAIDWAISKGVDIISMSFTIGDKGTLADALIKATKQGIVMTCSSHGEGSKTEMAYPASLKGTDKSLIVLAACDEYGRALWGIEKDDYHYLLPGQNVAAGVIPFLKSNDTISGSSVATAVTAGICSLTLTCDRLANPGRSYNKGMEAGSRYAKVIKELDSMKSKAGSRHILLKKFGEIDTYGLGAGANPGPQEILNRHFR